MWDHWWVVFIVAIPFYAVWTLAHEGAHALAVVLTGGRVTEFKPWPGKVGDQWYFARIEREGGNTVFMLLAPYILDSLAYAALVYAVATLQGWQWWVSTTAICAPVVNTVVGALGRYRDVQNTDLNKVGWRYAVPYFALMITYVAVTSGLITWRLT